MANICIIKDKKFRERAKAFNISTDTLEHITYKYYEEKKSNDQNPSDTYIKAQLGEFSYVEENPKIAELAKSIWDSKYSKPLSFDSEEQREKAKNAAEAIFPPQVILLYTDSQDKKVLTIRKPVAKLDIKYRKDFPDWHNYNDYLLVMGDAIPQNERQVEQKKTGPQPFTFNDGVTVTAPFKPNEQQVEALNAISNFINSDEVSMTLSGYAGTGKTSLMELIAAKMKKQHRKIIFTASTNKAAAVLKSRVKKAGFTAQTLNKVFGIQVEVDSSKPYDASNLVTLLKEADVSSGTVVVIDEASMINEENYSILNKIAKDNNLKIIYTGDKGQLAPVKEAKISKVFRDKNRKVVTLTKVERTDDNAILKEATALRNGQPLSGESSFNNEGKGVAYIKPANKEGKRAIVKAFAPMLRKKPDFFRILAFTNKAVADYNTAVRNTLGYHNSTPRVGEPIVGYSNWGAEYDRRTKQTTYRFINSESYNIVGIKPAHKVSYTLENGTKVELMANTATIEDSEGKKQKVDIIDIKDNPQNLEAATILAKEKSRLFGKARTLPRKEQPAVYREINAIEEFLFVNDNIKEGGRTLQSKTFDFGYAMTVHKSQGSTFTHVLVDDTDIAKARSQSAQDASLDYDTFSSMIDNLDNVMEGIQTTDSGFDSASSDMQVTSQGNLFAQMQQSQGLNTQTINNQANETLNMRQQLEYVAVSRATDTVTIISNNVKTEDSPINHVPQVTAKDSLNRNSTITQQSAFDVSKAEFYSGAAEGADKAWGDEARGLGIKVTDYTRDSWNSLSQEWKNKLSAEYEEVARALARPVIPLGNRGDIEVRRDMMQADKADAIFAVGSVVKPEHKGTRYTNKSSHDVVDGGTGYAVQRGIIRGIPVYVFDQSDNQWKVWDRNSNTFISTSEPTLTPHAATIGTRGINDAGRQAIRNVLAKTLGQQSTQQQVKGDNSSNQAPVPEASPLEQTSQKISLPSYEYFNDLYEGTEVDAAWKIPVLQDLDSQLSTENTEDENLQILSKMDRVLQSPSQEEYEKAPTPQQEEINKQMEEYFKRNQQLNNLLDNNVGLSPSEIRSTAETIVNTLIDIITEIQQHPEKATEYWSTLKTDKDLSKLSRKEIVEILSVNRIMELTKQRFENLKFSEDPVVYSLYDSRRLIEQHNLVMNNWEAVIRFAGDIFVANEGFGIKHNSKKGNYEVEEREYQGYDYDDYSSYQDPEATAEETNEQEHWQIEAKTINVINSMTEQIRMAIHNCYELDRNGNKILDKWGIPKRVNKIDTVKKILYWTNGALNLNDMIARMEAQKERNPWVTQLTQRLTDKSGKEADFQSQFYTTMHRHFQLYGIGQYEDGHYKHKILNRHKALSDTIKGISTLFQMHQHPLFNRNSTINLESLKALEGWYNELETIRKKYKLMMVFTSGEDARGEYVTSNDLELSDSDIETATKAIVAASKMLGYVTTEEEVLPIINKDSIFRMTKALDYMLNHEGLKAQAKNNTKEYKPFEFKKENNIRGALAKFLQPMMNSLEETALNTIFEDGKMYQSNVIPSFLSQLFDSFAQSDENFKPWAESFYGNSQWFKKDGRWRTPWLATMMENPEARKAFEHHVQLNFNKHNYMRNLSPEEYTISCITNYFFKTTNEKNTDHTEAWFRVPIQSNKPSSEFIKFFSYRGIDYKKQIVSAMQEFFLQELDRIDTVRKRNRPKEDSNYISSWDEHGRHFMFLPFLNSYLIDNEKLVNEEGNDLFRNDDGTVNVQKNNELKSLLNEKLQAEQSMKPEKDMRLLKLVEEATFIYMQNRADQILAKYEKNGILKAAEKVENINDYGRSVRDNLENFLWNDFFAANNILQLTITDKAFYPTTAELQKRLAELHAPGVKANKYATDYGNPEKGIPAKRVSDGIYRTILISDYEGFTANIIDNLTEIFNRKIEQASPDEKQAWIALKESLVGENGRYRNINVTDGQAYSSPASYRKKMLMFGKWSQEAEELYQKIRSGNYSLDDIRTVFQPLKPFVYGHLHKKTGVQKAPIQEMNVPFQAKNSEYLLLMADALIQGEKTERPNILRAIYDVMEESEQLFPTKGIDTVQFKSAIKSGAQGIIHLSDFTENPAGEEMARTALREQMYIKDDNGKIVDYNYDTFVQSTDYDNYALQQEVPKHFQEHWQAEPSQKRANIMSDLDMWINPQGDKSDLANVNYYSWKDPDGTEHKLTAQEFRRKYEEVHAQNIEESFDELTKLFKFNSNSRLERNIALSELLQEEIESSPRYGIDLLQACQIDPKTGEFRIPKGDPIQSKRIEQLINSIIKNRVNKQKLAGGPIVQVTNWGTSRQLHIRFNDKNGNLLKTKEEYEQQPQQESYQDYIKKNQTGIAHFEIFAPASWKKHLEKFRNPDGSVNFEAIERCDPNLLKMITSRIPNEDKYSIAHGKIVGFMPEVAGEAIMFPYELTEIDDSDFDVDKRYCHVFEIEDIVEKDWNEISDSLLQKGQELYQQYFHTNIPERNLQGIIDAMVKNPQKFPTPNEFRKDLLTYYMGVRYEVKYPKKGTRADRNNQILNMDWAVLSNEMTASKILNPGGFDIPKHDAYVIAVYKAKNGTVSWETLEGKTTKQLQKMMPADGDLAWFDTQVQFYKQNAAGSTLIGIFAVNKVAHAFLEADDILIDVDDVCGEGSSFNIADKEFTGRIEVDPAQDSNGAYVGKQLGSMVGASADTAKDAWLDLIDINMTTTNVYNTLLRFGMPQKDAALFMSQDVLVTALEEYNRANMEEPVTFDSIISKKIMTIGGKYGYNQDSEINREPLTRGELKYGLLHDDNLSDNVRAFKDKIDYKVLLAFSNLQRLASAIRKPTFVTRLNSISSAVGPLIIDNIILEHKLREFLESENLEGTGFYSSDGTHLDMDDLLSNHPMLRAFSKAIDSREPDCPTKILFADMPAGSGKFKGLIEAFPDNIKDNIYKNRQLLSKLSDFYQSYMLVANGIINPAHLGDYIKKFPEYFVAKRIKEKYPDNAFIQAIQPFKKNGRGFLNTETTGMTEQEKERLRMAWTDLHKVNSTLSKQLLTYAFFRRGIGFSPETWTDLLSVYVKEHITSDNKNGSSVSYVDTYRHFPTNNMVESIIMEQFIRNNWNDSRIVPVKGGEGTYYDYSHLDKGILYVHSKKDKDNLQGIQFMRTTVDKKTYLWKRITPMKDTDSSIEFQRIMPLGNNGEYIEMSLEENMKALEEVDELKQNDEQPELPDNAPKDAAVSDDSSAPAPIVSITEQAKSITDIVKYMITSRNLSEKVAVDYMATLHKKAQDGTISKFSKQDIQRIAKDNGLNLDVDAALEWFKNLC